MDFESTVSYIFIKVGTLYKNLLERKVRTIGLHSGQVFVLMELWKRDGQRQIDLAAQLQLAPPTINKILGGLLEGDFVTRARYEDDARSSRIFLTRKGNDVRLELEALWMEMESETLADLTETERLMFIQLLRKLFQPSGQ